MVGCRKTWEKQKNLKEASLKGLFEILLHAQEEKAKEIIIWTENEKFFENLDINSIRKKKMLRELYDSFKQVQILKIDGTEIENIEKLRDSVFSSAKLGSQFRIRRKRFHLTLFVADKDVPPGEAKRRMKKFHELMAEAMISYIRRPVDEKIQDKEEELRELDNNIDEHPDYEKKRSNLLAELKNYKEEKAEADRRLEEFERQKAEKETRRKADNERIKKILMKHNFCSECGKKIETDWKFCPFCSARIKTKMIEYAQCQNEQKS